jgi:hypothetical protein
MAPTDQDHAHQQEAGRAVEIRTALFRLLQLMAGEVARQLDRPVDLMATPAAATEIERENEHILGAGRRGAPPIHLFLLAIRCCGLIGVAAASPRPQWARFELVRDENVELCSSITQSRYLNRLQMEALPIP